MDLLKITKKLKIIFTNDPIEKEIFSQIAIYINNDIENNIINKKEHILSVLDKMKEDSKFLDIIDYEVKNYINNNKDIIKWIKKYKTKQNILDSDFLQKTEFWEEKTDQVLEKIYKYIWANKHINILKKFYSFISNTLSDISDAIEDKTDEFEDTMVRFSENMPNLFELFSGQVYNDTDKPKIEKESYHDTSYVFNEYYSCILKLKYKGNDKISCRPSPYMDLDTLEKLVVSNQTEKLIFTVLFDYMSAKCNVKKMFKNRFKYGLFEMDPYLLIDLIRDRNGESLYNNYKGRGDWASKTYNLIDKIYDAIPPN